MNTLLIDAYSTIPAARRLGLRPWIARMARDLGFAFIPAVADRPPLQVRINQGRWITDCDNCTGAENVTADDPVMYCFSCGNSHLDGQLAPVQFPGETDRRKIEELLLVRQRINQNWTPTEPVGRLRDENRGHGIVTREV